MGDKNPGDDGGLIDVTLPGGGKKLTKKFAGDFVLGAILDLIGRAIVSGLIRAVGWLINLIAH